jgi:ribosomal-protein-alanine N-acetyltransferase
VKEAIEIRPATRDDLDAIARIQGDSRGASAWEPSSYLGYDCRVALLVRALSEDQVVGFIVSRKVTVGDENAEREILNLIVDPAYRRHGIGRALIEAELAAYPLGSQSPRVGSQSALGLDPQGTVWFLEVRESNFAAISLYTAMGFTIAGRRQGYYNDPAETAIVMRFLS